MKPPLTLGLCGALCAAIGLGACAEGDTAIDAGAEPVVRDSSGVRIVENPAEALERAAAWSLSPSPALQIGSLDGPAEQQLYGLRGVKRLPDGSLVVLAADSTALRVYDSDGEFVRGFGGEGEGPGEFRFPLGPWILGGDTILVWDPELRRASLFTADGQHLGDARVGQEEGFRTVGGAFADRTLLVIDARVEDRTSVPRMWHAQLLRYDLNGALVDSLGRYPWRVSVPLGREGHFGRPVFGRRTVWGVLPRGYWVGTASAYEVRRYELPGRLVGIVRWQGPDLAVREEDRARYREARLAAAEDAEERRLVRTALANTRFADRFPAYSDLRFDADSNLWVRAYRPSYVEDPNRWVVFDPEGRLLARAETPSRLHIHEIGQDFVLGQSWDDLGIEYVQLYRLQRP